MDAEPILELAGKRMKSRKRRASWGLLLIGAVCAVLVMSTFKVGIPGLAWAILPLLALVTELLPIQLSRKGVRVTFSLPFLAAMAVTAGAPGALMTEIVITCMAAYLVGIRRGQRVDFAETLENLAIGSIGVYVGAICMGVAGGFLGAMTYTIGSGLANLLLVGMLDRGERRVHVGDILKPGIVPLFLYTVLALAASQLVQIGAVWALPLTLGPILGIRAMVKAQARASEDYHETITTLAMMLQHAHPYTHRHLARVALASEEVALRLGLGRSRAKLVREAAILHDLGKIAIDEDILDKPAKLTDEEFAHVKQHSAYGEAILEPVHAFRRMRKWIRHHHERPDGRGYPDGLRDVEIPIESKIIAVVDAFDAMTGGFEGKDKRTYRDPMTPKDALAELERCSGTQFDKAVVVTFKEVVTGGAI